MSLSTSHSDQYYLNLLEKYIEGSISREDLHVLEKQALDDPFLGDALEGYYYADQKLSQKHLGFLKTKTLSPKKATLRKFPIWKMSGIAASLIFVIGISFLLQNDGMKMDQNIEMVSVADTRESKTFAKNDAELTMPTNAAKPRKNSNENQKEDTFDESRPAINNIETPEIVSVPKVQNATKDFAQNTIESNEQPKDKNRNEVIMPEIEADEEDLADEIMQEAEEESMDDIQSPPPVLKNKAKNENYALDGVAVKKSKSKASSKETWNNAGNILKGKIIDTDSLPLIGANVIAMKDGELIQGTITNFEGEYELNNLEEGELDLEISYTGYQEQRFGNMYIPEGISNKDIALEEGNAMSEVVVTATKSNYIQDAFAEPFEGYQAFAQYIKEYQNMPQSGSSVSTYVMVSFTILPDGTLEKIKVLESNAKERHEQAIEIIRKGGKWKIKEPKKAPYLTTYRVEF